MADDITPNGVRDIALAAQALFESGAQELTLPRCGKVVTIKPATVRTIGKLMELFQAILTGLAPSTLATIIGAVSEHQAKAVKEGRDPTSLAMSPADIVQKALGNVNVLGDLFGACIDTLTGMASTFSSLTEDEFMDMDLDDSTLVAASIFMVNYDFFTQRLLPILQGWFASRASKVQSISKTQPENVQKKTPAERVIANAESRRRKTPK